jgi:hypothetical protein
VKALTGRSLAVAVTIFLLAAPSASADPIGGSPDVLGVVVSGFAHDSPTIEMEPAALAFPATPRASSVRMSVTVTNTGDGLASIGVASVSGPDASAFRLTGDRCSGQTLAAGGSCKVGLTFNPHRLGQHAATLTLTSDDAAAPHRVSLSGEGLIDGRLTVEPSVLDFGLMMPPFNALAREVVVRNIGEHNIRPMPFLSRNVGVVTRRLVVATDTCFGRPLPPGQSCRVGIELTPALPGTLAGTLAFRTRPSGPVLASARLSGEVRGPEILVMNEMLTGPLVKAVREWRTARRAGLRRRGFRINVEFPLRGRAVLKVVAVQVRGPAASERLIASGAVRVFPEEEAEAAAGVTRAGRRMLRTRRPLRLRVELTFRALDGRSWSASRRVRLRR